jgi:hypothetical protein
LQGHLLKRPGGDREMVEILALVLQHDEQAVLCAVEMALDAGIATKTHILNLLHRLIDGKPGTVTPIDAPQALNLRIEPKSDAARYDGLRRKEANRAS